MTRLISPGVWATAAAALGGLWMAGAPFWLGYQAPGARWGAGTVSDVVTGLGAFVLGALGILVHCVGALRDAALSAPGAAGSAR